MKRIDNEWRKWIFENLLLDSSLESMLVTLVGNGFDEKESQQEIEAARNSPYLQGAKRMQNRLRKRDWMLGVYRALSRMRSSEPVVERRQKLSRKEFFNEYYCQNRPVVITGMLDEWPAMQKWSFDYFRERFGQRMVEVQFGRETDPNFEQNRDKHRRAMPFGEYATLCEKSKPTNDFYMTANNTGKNREALKELWDDITQIPEYLNPNAGEKGFFWLGPAGTKTPFHHDLTNNFMAQVMGRKLVKLVPFHDTPFMSNYFHCYSNVDGSNIDFNKFPQMKCAQVIECMIGPGDILFLPIGYWHYVGGLDASVTMSFTNFFCDNSWFANSYTTFHEV